MKISAVIRTIWSRPFIASTVLALAIPGCSSETDISRSNEPATTVTPQTPTPEKQAATNRFVPTVLSLSELKEKVIQPAERIVVLDLWALW